MDYQKLDAASKEEGNEKFEEKINIPLPEAKAPRKCEKLRKLLQTKITVKHVLIVLLVYSIYSFIDSEYSIGYKARRARDRVMSRFGEGLANLLGYEKSPILVRDPLTGLETYRWRSEIENDPRYRDQLDALDNKN
ncbi:unnamed protein product [Bursaphelenchus xylophilus]|uniref:(pine wood nematode) hypothetical protein n=1 Tax=Bursaphelenchus xylophilus TaxID=6326 RepID=A0A1I7SRR7_BURXY|nr:unnamed protein product [Bursaphelenchus xylophilus]CAG9101926.1 unnamed protein product [Bursaphelenchus xylophilus]